jgi:hypothetical protein
MGEEVKLDWSSAEVQERTLAIALEGKLEKGWKHAFERTTRLLNRGAWEEVTLKKGKVVVRPITPGDEDRVRHFLEGVVLQANSDVETPDEGNGDRTDDTDDARDKEASATPEDQEMTERLRSFAEAGADD